MGGVRGGMGWDEVGCTVCLCFREGWVLTNGYV
jgi:hypothetical protein